MSNQSQLVMENMGGSNHHFSRPSIQSWHAECGYTVNQKLVEDFRLLLLCWKIRTILGLSLFFEILTCIEDKQTAQVVPMFMDPGHVFQVEQGQSVQNHQKTKMS